MISPSERSVWEPEFPQNNRWVSHYQSLAHSPSCPPLLLPFHLHPFLPQHLSRAYYVIEALSWDRWYKDKDESKCSLPSGSFQFVGDPVCKPYRETSATVQVWVNPEGFSRCFDSKEEMLTSVWRRRVGNVFRGEETLRVVPVGGRLCSSRSHVRSGEGNKILPTLPSRQTVIQGSPHLLASWLFQCSLVLPSKG